MTTPTERVHDIPTTIGTLHVRVIGDDGHAAVLWHSLFVDSRSWDAVTPALSPLRRLILIDGPSHGRSQAAPRLFTLADCASAAVEVLDTLDIPGPVDWVGNAWGGHVGMIFAAAHPARTRSLITFANPVTPLTPAERRRFVPLIATYRALGATGFICNAVVDAMLTPQARAQSPSAADLVAGVIRGAQRHGMRLTIQSVMLDRPDLTEYLPRIGASSVLVAGTDNPAWTPADAADAASKMPHAHALTVAGTRILLPIEAPDAVIAMTVQLWDATGSEIPPRTKVIAVP
jgi:pimeloyl-ACP methyl ester carboxylesterase